jgi:hypothetical protein
MRGVAVHGLISHVYQHTFSIGFYERLQKYKAGKRVTNVLKVSFIFLGRSFIHACRIEAALKTCLRAKSNNAFPPAQLRRHGRTSVSATHPLPQSL